MNIGALFGLSESPTDASQLLPYILESDRHVLMECVMKAMNESLRQSDCEYRIRRPDTGEIRWLLSRLLLGLDEEGNARYLASMCFDVTEQKQAEEHLQRSNDQLEHAQKLLISALQAADIAIFRHSLREGNSNARTYDSWTYNLEQLFGYPEGTVMTPELQIRRMDKQDYEDFTNKAINALRNRQPEYQHESRIQWEDQSVHWLLTKCTTEIDENGQPAYVSGAVIDITERKLAEQQMQYIATHDALTGLPNRFMFTSLLNHTIDMAARYHNRFAVLFIDLDRFKSINDALGHQAGDQLLVEIAHRISKSVRSSDVLARLSGDEFVVLVPELEDEEAAAVVARKIIAETSRPYMLLGQQCQVTASIGICIYPKDGDNEQLLMKNADAAMYIAKDAGKNNYQFYNAANTSQSLERMALENELRSALANHEFSLQYQAKIDLRDDSITGVEALLRWNNARFGQISPAVFIPMAEETGLIVPIGDWVLMTACKQNVEWQKKGMPPIGMAVNISARQFINKNLLASIKHALDESGMQPELLELEITESMVMHHVDQAVLLMQEIKALGARIAIDDFGTGYSSLAQLKRFPIDTLKIDRTFIHEIANDNEDQAITEAIIAMGKSLSLTIVAEGVETSDQQNFLRSRACDEMQGFYFSKPLPPNDFMALFDKQTIDKQSIDKQSIDKQRKN
ncbi:MAG: EAL domain-containing protein [Spongiibacteraceae bacterium]